MNLQLAKINLKYEDLIQQFKSKSELNFFNSDLDICEMYIEIESPHFLVGICDLDIFSDSCGIFNMCFHVPKDQLEYKIKRENLPSEFKIISTPKLGLYKKIYIIGYQQKNDHKYYCYLDPSKNIIISDDESFLAINLNMYRLLDIWNPNKKLFTKEEMSNKIQSIL